jgi:ABC-type transport system involved in Fe-S cluster assembly fused permease/ATPase subunit
LKLFWLKLPNVKKRLTHYTRLVITYASLAGLWYAHGWRIMLITFVFYLIFSMFTFARGSRFQINKWARIDFERKKEEADQKGESFDKKTEWNQSLNFAKKNVEEWMRKNGKL